MDASFSMLRGQLRSVALCLISVFWCSNVVDFGTKVQVLLSKCMLPVELDQYALDWARRTMLQGR
jgi:hypothetical protein